MSEKVITSTHASAVRHHEAYYVDVTAYLPEDYTQEQWEKAVLDMSQRAADLIGDAREEATLATELSRTNSVNARAVTVYKMEGTGPESHPVPVVQMVELSGTWCLELWL